MVLLFRARCIFIQVLLKLYFSKLPSDKDRPVDLEGRRMIKPLSKLSTESRKRILVEATPNP